MPLLGHPKATQVIKWLVYLSLLANYMVYISDDLLAFRSTLADGADYLEVIRVFTTSIDVAAWLGLVFLFELETWVLPEEAFDGWAGWVLPLLRLLCYISIAYAAYGYTANLVDYYDTAVIPGVSELCQLVDRGFTLQTDFVTYEQISLENCGQLSQQTQFFRVADDVSAIDAPMLQHARFLAWVDVANSYAWIVVVLLIELEIRMQAADRFGSSALNLARQVKTVFYLVLWGNAAIWLVTGYPMYTFDAMLWIVGFWAIELNLAGWEQERVEELAEIQGHGSAGSPPS
jgi:hypothetical protein